MKNTFSYKYISSLNFEKWTNSDSIYEELHGRQSIYLFFNFENGNSLWFDVDDLKVKFYDKNSSLIREIDNKPELEWLIRNEGTEEEYKNGFWCTVDLNNSPFTFYA